MTRKIIIFYLTKYSGHFKAACALEKALQEVYGDVEIHKIDALDYTNPILGKIVNKAYIEVIKKKPEIWGRMYDNVEMMERIKKIRKALHSFNKRKMKKLIDCYSPDAIFCTQAFPCGMVSDYKKLYSKKTPLIAVLTDHAAHSYWLHDEVDFYVVPSEETAEVFEKKGVPLKKIRIYGIPIDPKFHQTHDRALVKQKIGIQENSPVILVMGGSQGLGVMKEVVKAFLKDTKHNYQLLVVTGSNKKLYRQLRRLERRKGKGIVRILSYIDNIDELMEIADVIVTKAGGMTTSEALAKNLPMLIMNPIPGQERMNTDYLVKKDAAIEIKDYGQIYQKINEIFSTKKTLKRMRNSIGKISIQDSALKIAKLVNMKG